MTAYKKCQGVHLRGSWWCAASCALWGQIHSRSISLELTSEMPLRQGLLTAHLSPVTHQDVGWPHSLTGDRVLREQLLALPCLLMRVRKCHLHPVPMPRLQPSRVCLSALQPLWCGLQLKKDSLPGHQALTGLELSSLAFSAVQDTQASVEIIICALLFPAGHFTRGWCSCGAAAFSRQALPQCLLFAPSGVYCSQALSSEPLL